MESFERQRIPQRPFDILSKKVKGKSAAIALTKDISSRLGVELQEGLTGIVPDQVLAAMALINLGMTPESVSQLLTWREFEGFCAHVLKAHGYAVLTNIVITKPRRQIDIFAEAKSLSLSVDCKHWGRPFSAYSLERVASEQIDRTVLYKQRRPVGPPILPVILTMIEPPAREALGVPVVPIFAVRDFLSSVNRFDAGLAII